jgi:hypothetical protein
MAQCDKATDIESENFAFKKTKILSSTKSWNVESRKYLEAVLDGLEAMTAFYSYGNGDIAIEDSSLWNNLDSTEIIPMINSVIKPELDIEVSDNSHFPTALWFEVSYLTEDDLEEEDQEEEDQEE